MRTARVGALVAALIGLGASYLIAADRKLAVAIEPFDVATIEGSDESMGQSMAKVVRIEMIKTGRLQPTLVPKPGDAVAAPPADASSDDTKTVSKPAAASKESATGRAVIVRGTILSADSSETSNNGSSPDFLDGRLKIGGRLNRKSATVEVHVELVDPASGDIIEMFEVSAKDSESGLGSELSTSVGDFNIGDAAFDKSPTGRALRKAAQNVALEVAKRADTLSRR